VPSLTALQNVELPGRLAGRSLWSNRELATKALQDVGAGDLLRLTPDKLTPAQASRVSLARVLTQNPKIVFADEPTDRLSVADSRVVINAIVGLTQQGSAAVLCTHDLHLAARADRVVALVDGSIQAVLDHPTAAQVLDCLGQATQSQPGLDMPVPDAAPGPEPAAPTPATGGAAVAPPPPPANSTTIRRARTLPVDVRSLRRTAELPPVKPVPEPAATAVPAPDLPEPSGPPPAEVIAEPPPAPGIEPPATVAPTLPDLPEPVSAPPTAVELDAAPQEAVGEPETTAADTADQTETSPEGQVEGGPAAPTEPAEGPEAETEPNAEPDRAQP
jgi:energy-coupling factor transporter ATP-binding protein EcfA2